MRLVTFVTAGKARVGAVAGERVIDLAAASAALAPGLDVPPIPSDMEELIKDWVRLLPSARRVVSHVLATDTPATFVYELASVELAPPLPRPPKIICVARNYAEHAKEAGLEISPIPILFARFPATLVAAGKPIVVPKVSEAVDWEGELAVIIGKGTNGKRLSKEEAMDYVFGYSLFNDVTVRDYQFRVTQYTAGKNFRSSGPFGPAIVTADEIPNPNNLTLRTVLNGKVEQQANTSTMIYDIPTILAHVSDFIDLEPGDVIPTGTPAGVGFKRKPPEFLRDGDTISVEVPEIGVLTNPVVYEGRL